MAHTVVTETKERVVLVEFVVVFVDVNTDAAGKTVAVDVKAVAPGAGKAVRRIAADIAEGTVAAALRRRATACRRCSGLALIGDNNRPRWLISICFIGGVMEMHREVLVRLQNRNPLAREWARCNRICGWRPGR